MPKWLVKDIVKSLGSDTELDLELVKMLIPLLLYLAECGDLLMFLAFFLLFRNFLLFVFCNPISVGCFFFGSQSIQMIKTLHKDI